MNRLIGWADYSGMLASMVCLVHCLAVPVLLLLAPALLPGEHEESLHHVMALVVTVLAAAALVPGVRAHRRWRVALLGLAGWLGFLAAVFVAGPLIGEVAEVAMASVAGVLLFCAHAGNRHYCKCCARARRNEVLR